MKKKAMFAAMLACAAMALLAPMQAQAAPANRQASGDGMGGRFGVMAADLGSLPSLGATYWASDKLALDAALGISVGSPYAGGTDSAGRPVNDGVNAVALAFAGRYTLAQPVRPLLLQVVARLGVGNDNRSTQVLGVTRSSNDFNVGALIGVGVEVFVLGDSLSIQADSGLSVQSTSSTSNVPGAVGINNLTISLGQAGRWLPMNVAVHYYF